MTSRDSLEENFQQIKQILERDCKGKSLDGIFFPENTLFFKIKKGTKTKGLNLQDPILDKLRELSVQYQTDFFLTSPLKEKDHIYNATLWISPQNPIKVIYKKIHLFDVTVKGSSIRESAVFSEGKAPAVIQWLGWKIGCCICYDLRFPGLSLFYGRSEVDLILFPSAFLVSTGEKHWEILLRARAIENQCYVLAPAQSGKHISFGDKNSFRLTYGHSLGVSPQGRVLCDMDLSAPKIKTISLDKDQILEFRKQIPMKKHRKRFSVS